MSPAKPPSDRPGPRAVRRLLVIDDEPEIRRGYREILAPEAPPLLASSRGEAAADETGDPFELVEAESGEQALECLRTELAAGRRFAGAFVDVRMPGRIDGLQFIREAWTLDPDLLAAVTTAYQDRSVLEIDRFFGHRFQDQWDYLSKPFTSGEVIQKARQMVSAWNRRRTVREQQAALVGQERLAAVGRLARNVGHEFGNILQPLMGKLELARARLSSGRAAEVPALLDEMLDAATIGATVCQDLLVFARESRDPSPSQPVPITRPVNRALALLRHELRKKDARVRVSVPDTAAVSCHEPRVVQLFVNLITNALDAIKDGGALEISGTSSETSIEIRVRDDGHGIPRELQTVLFEPLFTTKGDHGNGLGLSVCRQVTEDYGGSIGIESEQGRGTTVVIRFPLARGPG
jgi:signal transduction histidine kinase